MTLTEALATAAYRQQLCRTSWGEPPATVSFERGDASFMLTTGGLSVPWVPTPDDFRADDWEIVDAHDG